MILYAAGLVIDLLTSGRDFPALKLYIFTLFGSETCMVLEVVANLMKLGPIAVLVQLVNFFQASKRANLVNLIHSGTSPVN